MPWCDDCSKFWNPPELAQSRDCPTCGRRLVAPAPVGGPGAISARAQGSGAVAAGAGVSAAGPSTAGVSAAGPSAAGAQSARTGAGPAAATAHPAKAKGAPWHFKVLVVGVTGYMIYRIYWLIEWLPKHV